ncbi:MAG: SAM-dependent DNA methyltransferase, partial [Bacteroidetes bacterium]
MDKLIRRILLLSTQYKIDDIDTALIQNYIDSLNLHVIRNSSLKEITNSKSKEIWEIKTWLNQNQIKLDLDLLLKYYELQVSPQDRKKNGSYYTPNNVINFIIDRVVIDGVDKILDPACGSGAFLLGAAIKLKKFTKQTYKEIFDKYIYGVDIVPINVYRTKIILTLLALSSGEDEKNFNFNIYQGDSLAFDWEIYIKNFEGFKYIVGNPPYVRTKNLTREMRESLTRWSTTYLGNMDLYIPFFELGLSLLSKDGIMGYISPNTYFTSLNARVLRQLLKQKRVVKTIIDFDGLKIFKGATTYTGITILTARPNEYISFNLIDDYNLIDKLSELKPTHIRYEALGDDEWRLLSEKDLNNIRKIESVGSPLFKYAKRMITGIATLNNNLYLIDGNKKNGQYFLKTYKNKSYLIEKEVTRKIIKPNIIKSEAALAHNRERIIYPYISKDGKYELIPEETLKKQFPKTYE